eukprot:1172577-Alexandrium_andersonii.AAC.1
MSKRRGLHRSRRKAAHHLAPGLTPTPPAVGSTGCTAGERGASSLSGGPSGALGSRAGTDT